MLVSKLIKIYDNVLAGVRSISGFTGKTGHQKVCNYNETVLHEIQLDKTQLEIHAVWLRHHCPCELCVNKQTHQRMKIPSDLPVLSTISKYRSERHKLVVHWKDGHESHFNSEWLKKYAPKVADKHQSTFQDKLETCYSHCLESGEAGRNFSAKLDQMFVNPMSTAIPFGDFMREGSDDGVAHLLSNVLKHGYAIVSECPADFDTTKKVISRVSHPQNTIFGDYSEWTSNLAYADTAYTTDFVHLHTDTSYFTEPVGLQIFHCLKHDGTGGINFLVDGFQIARKIALNNMENYKQLASVNIPCQYIDSGKHYFYSNDVTLGHDSLSGKINKIRYNPHDMSVLKTLSFENVAKFYESLVDFSNLLETDPLEFKLNPGTVLFLDNWRTLHGRSAFTGFRHLCGAYISRSDWLSRARTIGLLHTEMNINFNSPPPNGFE